MFRCIAALLMAATITAHAEPPPRPPVARQVPHVVKSPHGDRVDEYFWLRDDDAERKRPDIVEHLKAETAYAEAMLAPGRALHDKLVAEMRGRIREDDSSVPAYDHGWWTWRRFEPGAEYPVLMRRKGTPAGPDFDAPEQVVLDQPARAKGQRYYDVGATAVSPDGRYLAWTEDTGGRRIHTLRVRDLQTGELLPDAIGGVLEPVVWAADNRTIFYIRQDPVTLQSGPVFRHVLGTAAGADVKVYEERDKTQFVSIGRSASGRFVVIHIGGHDTAETRAVPTDRPTARPRVVLARKPGVRHDADHLDGRWVVRTNERARNFRLVEAPEKTPDDRRTWRTLVPARRDAAIDGFALFHGAVAIEERVDADPRVRVLPLAGSGAMAVTVGEPAVATSLGENLDPAARHVRHVATSLVRPETTFDLELATGQRTLRKERPVPGYDASLYRTERLWAPARDGLRIPVTVAWRVDRARRDGRAPAYIDGYGAYGYSNDPHFASTRVSLLDRGFVVAIAHVRGGAELGQDWYEAGRLMRKKNTFNDYVDVTEFLVRERWADPKRVFGSGGSAGGLLIGAVANMAGDLYRGLALHVPFVDAVTTMLDETIPLTANEWSQWGDPRKARDYRYILSYSPYDNIAARPYPAMLVTTGLWDSQVQYYEPAKYVARLRARKTDANPLLFHVQMDAGHGGRPGRFEALDEVAREYVFFLGLAGITE
jgi:oligopeptidase B